MSRNRPRFGEHAVAQSVTAPQPAPAAVSQPITEPDHLPMMANTMIQEDGTELVMIHFLFQSPRGSVGVEGEPLVEGELTHKIACSPNALEMSANASRAHPYIRTDDAPSVTCPLCMQTEFFKSAMRRRNALLNARRS